MKLNFNTQIKFGYNAQYHKELHQNLFARKKDSAIAKRAIELDKFTLQLEDEIVELEKNGKTNSAAYQNLTEFLLSSKETVMRLMSSIFGAQKYCENLIDTYTQEALSISNDKAAAWRENLALKAIDYLPVKKKEEQSDLFKHVDVQHENIRPEQSSQEKTLEEIKEAAMDEITNKSLQSLLIPFKPTSSSPAGFQDVMGLDDTKEQFFDEIISYIQNPQLAKLDEEEYGIRAPRGYLFYGPPGCGKTFMAEALAVESGLDMYKMDVSKVASRYVNQSANNVQLAFDALAAISKKTGKQVILFLDEVDSLAISRDNSTNYNPENSKVTTTLLKFVEGARDIGVIPIAATNKYDLLDDAFVARFDGQKYFGLPDCVQIQTLLKNSLFKRLKGQKLAQDDEAIKRLSNELLGFSNRSIVIIVDIASKLAKRNSRSDISELDIRNAIIQSELEKNDEKKYQKNTSKQGKVIKGFGS